MLSGVFVISEVTFFKQFTNIAGQQRIVFSVNMDGQINGQAVFPGGKDFQRRGFQLHWLFFQNDGYIILNGLKWLIQQHTAQLFNRHRSSIVVIGAAGEGEVQPLCILQCKRVPHRHIAVIDCLNAINKIGHEVNGIVIETGTEGMGLHHAAAGISDFPV